MEQFTESKITPNDAIALMIKSVNADDKNSFYKVAERYVKTLSKSGENYWRVRKPLNEVPKRLMSLDELPREMKSLISNTAVGDENVYLNDINKHFVESIIKEWENSDIYNFHNLGIRNKILLHGPTGNGKTTIARHFARLSNLPFIEVSSDFVIDSHLGSTGANIHRIFNSIKEPCILFWDEIDTIGKKRNGSDTTSAGMENERMINSILVNIEKLGSDVIFIGATNRKEVLDSAFLRRFDEIFEIGSPTLVEKEMFAASLFDYYNISGHVNLEFVQQFTSFSEIKLRVIKLAREYVLEKLAQSV